MASELIDSPASRVPILHLKEYSFRERNTSISHEGIQEKRMGFVIASFTTSFHRIMSKDRIVYYRIYTKAGAITPYSNDQSLSRSFTRSFALPHIIMSLKKKLQSSLSEGSFEEAQSCVLVIRVILKPQGNGIARALPFGLLSYQSMIR